MVEFDASKAPDENENQEKFEPGFGVIVSDLMGNPNISATAKCLYAYLLRSCRNKFVPKARYTEFSHKHFATEMGFKSARALHKYFKELSDSGWITSKRRGLTRTNKTFVHTKPTKRRVRLKKQA